MRFNCLQQRMDVDLIAALTSTTADAWPGWEIWRYGTGMSNRGMTKYTKYNNGNGKGSAKVAGN